MAGWRLVLAGGSPADNAYLDKIRAYLCRSPAPEVELKVNVSASELKSIYGKAKLFWHFCGLGQTDPAKVEHFGMTVAEAMQNGCVPIAFRGGGQTEIVEDGLSGYLFSSEKELVERTLSLVENPARIDEMSEHAHTRGRTFRKEVFTATVRDYFRGLLASRFGL